MNLELSDAEAEALAPGGDLPIQEPVKFDFVVNLRTAKELGVAIPSTFLARADEVIE
jgi:putative ABC transport system substrate-binding protein